jgi:hypothetical protein
VVAVLGVTPAAQAETPQTGTRMELGLALGGVTFDPHLADYRWDTSPAMQSGMQAALYRGRIAAGARVWRSGTAQATGIPGTASPNVNLTGLEMTGQVRAFSVGGVALWGTAHAGRVLMGYDPDRLSLDAGGGSQVTVAFDPVSEWDWGGGAALRTIVASRMAIALQADVTMFSLDTVHRRGDEIVETRERFSSWGLRAQASWLFDLK